MSRSRERGQSSRSQLPPDMDTRCFQTVEQFRNYTTYFQNRPLRKEVEVVLGDFAGHPVLRLFEEQGWASMLTQTGLVNLSLIKEFYANRDLVRSSEFEFVTWVRGKRIIITPDIWSNFLEIGRPQHPVYPLELMGDDVPNIHFDTVAAFLTGGPYAWPGGNLPHSLLLANYRLLNLIVCYNIEPRGHHTDISHERGYLLYAIANNLHVDLPAFMIQQMYRTSGSARNVGMPFGLLLTRFMASKRVPDFADDTYVEVKKKLNAQTIHQSEAHIPRAPAAHHPIYVDENLTMGQRMENLEAVVAGGFEYMTQELADLREYVHQEMTQEVTDLRGYVHQELSTLTESMGRLEMASERSHDQMEEMLAWMRRQGGQ